VSFIDELAKLRGELAEEDGGSCKRMPRIEGVLIGRVVDLVDPLLLGRVRVRVPQIDGLDTIAFARMAVPGASLFSGMYWIPNPEDEVLLAFENGDPNAPYILGGVWNIAFMPPLPSPLPQIRTIRSPLGNQVVFTESPPTLTIQSGPTPPVTIPAPPSPVGPNQTIMLNSAGIQIIGGPTVTIACGDNLVTIGPQGVGIAAPKALNIVAGGSILSMSAAGIEMIAPAISMGSAAEITLNAGGAAAITAGGAATVTAGGGVTIMAGAAVTVLAGAAVTILAAGMAAVAAIGAVLLASIAGVFKAPPPTKL
jgi:hypothetical protein